MEKQKIPFFEKNVKVVDVIDSMSENDYKVVGVLLEGKPHFIYERDFLQHLIPVKVKAKRHNKYWKKT